MPGKSKEDTWGAKELTESIKEARSSGKSRHKDKDRDKEREKPRDKDRERHRDKDRDKDSHRDKEHERKRDKDRDRQKEKDKDRERRKDREGESSKEKDRERRKDREKDSSKDKDRREKDRDGRKEREKESSKEKDRGEKDRSKHREKEKDRDREKKERSHRDNKESAERTDSGKKERHRDRDEKKREREKESGSRDGDKSSTKDGDRDKRREEKRHRDKDRERRKEKESNDSDRERRKHRDKDGSADRRKREKSGERKHRKEHKEEKGRSKSEHKNGQDERHEKKREDEDDVGEEILKVSDQKEQQMEESNQDDGYEDDFEDYDDDFEDDDDEDEEGDKDPVMASEIDNLRRAMAAENEALRRSAESRDSRSQQSSASTRPSTSRTGRTFINFVAAKQRQISDQVSQRTKKRGQELMNLIDLDTTGFDLFDMPPVREYDRYIASFGRSNTKQAFVQCNDDNLDRDVQTEEIDTSERWTQHPQDGAAATGGSNSKEEDDELPVEREMNSLRYNRFMEKATQLFIVLLDEELANRVGGKLESNKRSIVFSDGYTLMNTGTPILQGRSINRVVIHPVQTNLIITMHSMPKADVMNIDDKDLKVMEKAGLTNRGLMCVWNVNEPSRPQKILVLKSMPTTCAFSPSKATMAFCGTADGSVCVWDLREPSSMHLKCEFGWGHIMVRVPTYSTEAGSPDESHHSRVVAMQPIVSADDAQKATSKSNFGDDSVGFSFQLATVDEKGTISFWVVIEIDKPDDAGSESDLGLVPGGRIKLIKSSSIQLQIPLRELGSIYQLKVTDMQLLPSNPNHFFVATDAGFISHGARNTERVSPKYFWVNDGVPVGVKCIDFSPFDLPCFLAASGDGSVQLFSIERGTPLVSWPNSTQGMAIVAISWSRSRPSVFYVMDITSKVYVWELLENDSGPVKTEQFTRGRLSALALANDHAATGWGVAGRKPEMIITDEMGSLDVHLLNSRFSTATASELDSFSDLLEQLI
ncbi:WD repeat-containing protein 60 isoform X2 [Strongylocentrotus purpuratus]|uniref:WD repeat-containing protein 60 n=1 Tax=Strongylocentrotus purpuratus TaxID=7668 RepID=A0A7M7MXD8_STRPU|nr:WD repeat-containing protein 60 isoform X2 [Strongylocentrotus purpuratus]